MAQPGYNLFALGPAGIGRHRIVRAYVDAEAEKAPVPSDWCYVNNFKESQKPNAIRLPAGKGMELKSAMERLIDDLRGALGTAFSSDEYRTRRRVIEDEFKERQQSAMEEVEKAAGEKDVALVRTPMGYAFAPTHDGKIITPDDFEKLDAGQREQFKKNIEELEKQLQSAVQNFPKLLQQTREKVRTLNEETASFAVGHMIDRLKTLFSDIDEVVELSRRGRQGRGRECRYHHGGFRRLRRSERRTQAALRRCFPALSGQSRRRSQWREPMPPWSMRTSRPSSV